MTSAAHRTGKRKRKKLPWQVSAIIARLHADEVLCRYLHQKKGGEGTEERFFFEPGGRACSAAYARRAISLGLLKPNQDGLFGDDTQTYKTA